MSKSLKLLFVGDVVGRPGRTVFARYAHSYKAEGRADVIVVNGENAAAGRGINPKLADELFEAGADVITLGDHTWDQKDLPAYMDGERRLIRPANFPPGCPGRGWTVIETIAGPLLVINLIGRVFMNAHDCPFRTADKLLKQHGDQARLRFVDIHCEATSEKIVTGRYLDGRVSAIAGTHTHVQTADETILPRGTGYITDAGMTGPKDSIIGREVEPIIQRFLTGMPQKFEVATEDVRMEGALFELDPQTGKCLRVTRVSERLA